MPQAKKKTSSRSVPSAALSKAYESELSYETQVIITILLLLFVYPIGLILMWWWMRNWSLWLKIIISLPLFLGVFVLVGMIVFVATLFHGRTAGNMRMRQRWYQQQMMYTTPAPSLPVTITPTQNTSGTY